MSDTQSSSPRARSVSLLADEEMEPYVRKKRANSEAKRKLSGLSEHELDVVRASTNSRERKRMHDLNDALEDMRSCLPYNHDANSRKLSKISTIILASNWIRQMTKENARLVAELDALKKEINGNRANTDESRGSSAEGGPNEEKRPIGGQENQLVQSRNNHSHITQNMISLPLPMNFPSMLPQTLLSLMPLAQTQRYA